MAEAVDPRVLELVETLHDRLDGLENTLGGTFGQQGEAVKQADRPSMSLEDRINVVKDGLNKAVHRVGAIQERVHLAMRDL